MTTIMQRTIAGLMLALLMALIATLPASAHNAKHMWSTSKTVDGHWVSHKHTDSGTLCRVDGKQFKLVSLNARNRDCVGGPAR